MAAGDVDVRIVEPPLSATAIDTAITASIAASGADATLAISSIRNGEALVIATVDIA